MATFTALLLSLAAPFAQAHDTPACPAPVAAPPELAGWDRAVPVEAGHTTGDATKLTIGTGSVAALRPTAAVRYLVPAKKPAGVASHGGIFAFTVATPGRYRVALGSAAWIDVVAGGTATVSVAHGHGPECSGIRKMVDFNLKPGRYLLQIVDSGEPRLPLMIALLSR